MESEIWRKYRAKGLTVIGVNAAERQDPEKMAASFVMKHGLTYPVVLDVDNTASEAYHLRVLPTTAIIDRKGVLRYLAPGFDEAAATAQLEKLLAEP